jgi:UDP-N-acetyl-D-mannosaminuronic acid transferase (WecB/TagA/CpsF family)
VRAIVEAARRGESFSAHALELEHFAAARSEPRVLHAIGAARFVVAGSSAVARMTPKSAEPVGACDAKDLLLGVAEAAAEGGVPIYIFGSDAAVLAKAALELAQRAEFNIDIAGTAAPSRTFDPEGPEAEAALKRVAASGARICILALDSPAQEILAARAVEAGLNIGFVCTGRAIERIARSGHRRGLIARAAAGLRSARTLARLTLRSVQA